MPTAERARHIVQTVLDREVVSVERFGTGLCHRVYDVALADGRRIVARLASPDSARMLRGGIFWSGQLRPLGVPLPELIAADGDGERFGIPYMLLERFRGADLGSAYSDLSGQEKRSIAQEIAAVQRTVHSLPAGSGYGYTTGAVPPPHANWCAVVSAQNQRTRAWMVQVGQVGTETVDHLEAACQRYCPYFEQVKPMPFLDDTTTKNVIVEAGRLSGIVDVDEVCYGDPLWPVGLTRASLLASGHDTVYTDAWCAALAPSPEQLHILDLYTAVFLVTFISEQGMQFNSDRPKPIDWPFVGKATRLTKALLGRA